MMTNYEHIQIMSQEEMAQMFTDISIQNLQATFDKLGRILGVPSVEVAELPEAKETYALWVEWLRRPVEDEHDRS